MRVTEVITESRESKLINALEAWMSMHYSARDLKTILSHPDAVHYQQPPNIKWLYRGIVLGDKELNSIKAQNKVVAFATELQGAITFIESLETVEDWVVIRKPFNPADFVLDFTGMYEAFVEPDNDPMSRYEVEHEVWMKAVPEYTHADQKEVVLTSQEYYGEDGNPNRPRADQPPPQGKYLTPEAAYHYALNVIKGRWPEGEPVIAKDLRWATSYAEFVIKGRWPEIEPRFLQDPRRAALYARDVLKKRWPKVEPLIAQDLRSAVIYAIYVLKKRWPEAEPVIMQGKGPYVDEYKKRFKVKVPNAVDKPHA